MNYFPLLVLLAVVGSCSAFRFSISRHAVFTKPMQVRMASEDPNIDAIRAKMQADPNYNPMTDPHAAEVLDSLIPDYLKEIPNSIERLNVAFKDATSGAEAIDDLDKFAASFENKRELISSPQSDFFLNGMKVDASGAGDSEAELEELLKKLQQQYPDIPFDS